MANEIKGLVDITTGVEVNDANANAILDLTSAQVALLAADVGAINGFVVTYNATDTVNIIAGYCIANGKYYTLAADDTHAMMSLAAGFGHHHIYIDDSASTAPTAVIIDSTTPPSWDAARNGWYNGDDRRIGVVESKDGAAEIATFATVSDGGKLVKNEFGRTTLPIMGSNMNPSASWQICNTNDGDVITPVGAISIKLVMANSDTGATVGLYSTNKEQGDIESSVVNGLNQFFLYQNAVMTQSFFALGASRKIYVSGSNDDDNALDIYMIGYEYLR